MLSQQQVIRERIRLVQSSSDGWKRTLHMSVLVQVVCAYSWRVSLALCWYLLRPLHYPAEPNHRKYSHTWEVQKQFRLHHAQYSSLGRTLVSNSRRVCPTANAALTKNLIHQKKTQQLKSCDIDLPTRVGFGYSCSARTLLQLRQLSRAPGRMQHRRMQAGTTNIQGAIRWV